MADDSWDSKAITVSRGRGFGPWYRIMRWIGRRCSDHFFSDVQVIGGEDVPATGPFILVCTHFSTIMDVAIISAHLPHNRPIHYWAKKGLYRGKLFAWILNDSGNIQVDRKNKDNQQLFKGTFDAMEAGEAIGLFPEGGSFTEPKLHSMKAGAAWAALEYAKHLTLQREEANGDGHAGDPTRIKTDVMVVPASINYTEKSRFRSKAVFQMGKAFSVDEFTEEFLSASIASNGPDTVTFDQVSKSVTSEQSAFPYSAAQTPLIPNTPSADTSDGEQSYFSGMSSSNEAAAADPMRKVLHGVGAPARGSTRRQDSGAKAAVQKLTDRIGRELNEITFNAPDWKTWHAMKVARELFWQGESKKGGTELDVRLLVPLSNALITLFVDDDQPLPLKQSISTLHTLNRLQTLQLASRTDLTTLNSIAPSISGRNYSFPTVPQTVRGLLYHIVLLAFKSPLYLPLCIFWAPAYFAGWWMSSKHAKHEEESLASVKSLVAFPVAFLSHCLLILIVASLILFTPPGFILGFLVSQVARKLQERVVLDDAYNHIKLIAAYGRCLFVHLGSVRSFKGDEAELDVMLRAVMESQPVQWTITKAFRRPAANAVATPPLTTPTTTRPDEDVKTQDYAGGDADTEAENGGSQTLRRRAKQSKSPHREHHHHLHGHGHQRRRWRRPAPIRLLKLTLETRREAVTSLRALMKSIREDGTQRQREALAYIESHGASLL